MSVINLPDTIRGRSLLTLHDFTPGEMRLMLDTAYRFKQLKYDKMPHRIHEGKQIALIFEKTSTRTRCAFTVAANDLGIAPEFLGKNDIQFGNKESTEDTAKVLGRMFDGLQFRGYKQSTVDDLAKYSGVPVWNGLTDIWHPTQILADFLTLEEQVGRLQGLKLAFVGDGRGNMANSLLVGSAMMGLDFRIVSPKELHPASEIMELAQKIASETGAFITLTDSIEQGVKDVGAIYTDVWVSMGEEDKYAERINLLKNYQVNQEMLDMTGNPDVKFLHCLPAMHDLETENGMMVKEKFGLDSMEVTDDVFRSRHSIVFDQAENRMHTIKAIMALTL